MSTSYAIFKVSAPNVSTSHVAAHNADQAVNVMWRDKIKGSGISRREIKAEDTGSNIWLSPGKAQILSAGLVESLS